MKVFLSLLFCLFGGLAQAGEGFVTTHSGAWRGVGVQDNGASWVVLLEVGGEHAEVDYPDIPCGGTWEYGLVLGQSITVREKLDYGMALCFNLSRVVLESPSETQLIASWYDEIGAEVGFAVLHRDHPSLNNLANEHAETSLTRMTRNLGLRGNPACLPPTS